MSIKLAIETDPGDTDVVLKQLKRSMESERISVFLREFTVPYLRGRIENRFAGEGDDASGKWAPLRYSTTRIRTFLGFQTGPINVRTGQMKYVLLHSYGIQPNAGGVRLTLPGVTGGELEKKISTAQRGRSEPKTVKRPVLAMNATDLEAIMESFRLWIVAEMTRP